MPSASFFRRFFKSLEAAGIMFEMVPESHLRTLFIDSLQKSVTAYLLARLLILADFGECNFDFLVVVGALLLKPLQLLSEKGLFLCFFLEFLSELVNSSQVINADGIQCLL